MDFPEKLKAALARMNELAKAQGCIVLRRPHGAVLMHRKIHRGGFPQTSISLEGIGDVPEGGLYQFAEQRYGAAKSQIDDIIRAGQQADSTDAAAPPRTAGATAAAAAAGS